MVSKSVSNLKIFLLRKNGFKSATNLAQQWLKKRESWWGKYTDKKYKNVFFDTNTNTIVFFGVLCRIFFARPDSSVSVYSSATANINSWWNGRVVIMFHRRNALLTKLVFFRIIRI